MLLQYNIQNFYQTKHSYIFFLNVFFFIIFVSLSINKVVF
jgi:hypothetical protein